MTLLASTRIYGVTFHITVISNFNTYNVTCRKLFGTNNMSLEILWMIFLAVMFFGDAFYFVIRELYKDRFPDVSKYQTTKAYWGE
jgi:TRAP-type mannitol/chloroaromatic compound transport system permease small subunit